MQPQMTPALRAAALTTALASPAGLSAAGADQPIAPLLKGMGDYHLAVTTGSAQAQRYFDQGMVLAFGFNHREAARSFRQAQALDPECAMCFWGEALVLGPNINAKMDAGDNPRAYAAVQQALALADSGGARERALIEAIAARYEKGASEDRSVLDKAYAKAMGAVARRFPDDPDVGSLYAEALMDTTPWDYWEADGSPKPVTKTILTTLERVMTSHPAHPLANHLYIHAVEKEHPEQGLAAADRLRGLVPGAGHLVHMPGHIYIRVGRYQDAIEVNEQAAAADNRYIAQCHAQGLYPVAYVPHNHHFLAAAAGFAGESGKAIAAARHIRAHQDLERMREPGYTTLQQYWVMPYFALVRFGHWKEILAEPKPAPDLIYPTGIWHYARGLALLRTGDLAGADASLAALAEIAEDPEMAATRIWETNTMAQLLVIARDVLAGEIALVRGDTEGSVERLRAAVAAEDRLIYEEPSDWYVPARHNLGAALLQAGRAAEAELVYRRDLEIYPDNGWSLRGLARSLEAQDRIEEAKPVRDRFAQVWSVADLEITSSRL